MGKDVAVGIELTRKALAELEDSGEEGRRKLLETTDKLSNRAVLHDENGDVLLAIISPLQGGDSWSMTLMFNGEVMGWFRHVELDEFDVAPVVSEPAAFARMLRVCHVFSEDDYSDFENCPGTENAALGRWIENRLNRIARKTLTEIERPVGTMLLVELYDCLRYLSVAMVFSGTKSEMRNILKRSSRKISKVTVVPTEKRSEYGEEADPEDEGESDEIRGVKYRDFFRNWNPGGN